MTTSPPKIIQYAKRWADPSTHDPLSEPTFNRRVWGAYLRVGYTRSSWSRALGASYSNAFAWDKGTKTPTLPTAARMSELVGYTLDELLYGHGGSVARRAAERSLTDAEIMGLLDELKAGDELCRAWGEYRSSPAGVAQRATRTYVTSFLQAYDSARAAKQSAKDARLVAMRAAANARAAADAHMAQLQPYAPPDTKTKRMKKIRRTVPTAKPTEA